jgi:7,8-dihydro-6-hydroxymethylpterin-pyrophosphokinase
MTYVRHVRFFDLLASLTAAMLVLAMASRASAQETHSGQVYQKDLGPRTLDLASRMTEYNPDKTWIKVGPTEPPK